MPSPDDPVNRTPRPTGIGRSAEDGTLDDETYGQLSSQSPYPGDAAIMNSAGKHGEYLRAGQSRRDTDRRKRKSRLFVLIANDERVILQIKELACTCIEIGPAGQSRSNGSSRASALTHIPLRDLLTARQFDIALGIVRGLSNKDIGRELGISHFTVRNHLSRILLVLGLAGRQELVELLRTNLLRLA